MFEPAELERAVRLQRKAYRLLRWFQETLKESPMLPSYQAHAAMDELYAAKDWIKSALPSLPEAARPAPDEVDDMAAIFASYLTTSFDVLDDPGTRLVSDCGCFCDICAHLVRAPSLRPKKLTSGDKVQAKWMKMAALTTLGAQNNRALSDDEQKKLLEDPAVSELAALVAYGELLVGRMKGDPGDPVILALWREFAWTRAGSPKRDFELDAASILNAERALLDQLRP